MSQRENQCHMMAHPCLLFTLVLVSSPCFLGSSPFPEEGPPHGRMGRNRTWTFNANRVEKLASSQRLFPELGYCSEASPPSRRPYWWFGDGARDSLHSSRRTTGTVALVLGSLAQQSWVTCTMQPPGRAGCLRE